MTAPLSDAKRARIIVLAQQELSVRQIAAEVGCSTGSVSNVCRLAGVQLDRAQTQAAAEVRTVSARAQRAQLADELLAVARAELARLRRPHAEYWGVGGQDPTVLSVTMAEPPPRARRDLISGAMALVDRHIKLIAVDTGHENNSIVDRWLAAMLGEDSE
jgi:precorrin-6B methylase 2